MLTLRFAVVTALFAALALPLKADVIVVDLGGDGDFTDVRSAVTVSQDGDIILVRPGVYLAGSGQPAVITGKGLTVVGDGPGVQVPAILVSQVPAGRRVILRNLDIRVDGFSALQSSLVLQESEGSLHVEDCTLVGLPGMGLLFTKPGTPAAALFSSAPATFVRCRFDGGAGIDTFFPYAPSAGEGGHGLTTQDTDLSLYDCTLVGGDAGDFTLTGPGPGGLGGDALRADGADVFVAGGVLIGGAGGDGNDTSQASGYAGGDAIQAAGGAVRTLDTTLTPGVGGFDTAGVQGPPGQALNVAPGSVTAHAGPARSYALTGPAREQGQITATYTGEPGDLFAIYYAFGAGAVPLPGKSGTWHLAFPWTDPQVFGPVTSPDGVFEITVALGTFSDPLLEGAAVFGQCFVAPAGGGSRLTSPTTFMVLDESF